MSESKKETIIAQISDIHVGEQHFIPSLLTRAIDEINDLNPDIVIITGDLTANGFRMEYETVRNYLAPIKCKNLIVQLGNHDSRNVGYLHFEELFGERYTTFKNNTITIVAADSSEPDLDNGQIGREHYQWISKEFNDSEKNSFKIFAMHHHLVSVPNTGRERNIVNDAGDVLETIVDAGVDMVLCGHKHVPYLWRIEDMMVVTAGTVSCLRLRGAIEPSYNIIYVREKDIDIYRRYPFDKIERIKGIKRSIRKARLCDKFITEKR
jgi:3',5'-cyclic-AMP phosphodiesterase